MTRRAMTGRHPQIRIDKGAKGPLATYRCAKPLAAVISFAARLWSLQRRRRCRCRRCSLDAGEFLAVELLRRLVASAALGHLGHRPTLLPLLGRHRRHRRHRSRGSCPCRGGSGARRTGTAARFGPLCPDRGGDRQGRYDRYAIQEMLHASVLYGSSGFDNTLQRRAVPEGGPCGPRAGNNRLVVSFPQTRNSRCRVSDLAGRG